MFAYCQNNPVNLYDESGDIPQAVQDKIVHNMVLATIAAGNSALSWHETCIYYNGKDWRGGWGFCDLYNTSTGEVWELKKDSASRSCTTAAATIQLNKYTAGRLKRDLKLPLQKPSTTMIKGGEFVFTQAGYIYDVTYWNEGNGILRYNYTTRKTEGRKLAEATVSAMALALLLAVAPEAAPAIALV